MESPHLSMTKEEYLLLNEFISERFGIHFPEPKQEILASRLRPRLKALHLRRYMDYYLHLQTDLNGEFQSLVSLVANNETYFFRETHQFHALFEEGLESLRRSFPHRRAIRVLCAGCASGEEPYTLNIYSHENAVGLAGTRMEIDAFDIDLDCLEIARRAEYHASSLRATTPEQLSRYFVPATAHSYRLRERFRTGVRFAHGNILELDTFAKGVPYDVVFCRNVLIYFSEPALRTAIHHFQEVLRPGGLLFLGHAESIIGKSREFQTLRLKRCIAYQKVAS